MTQGNRKWSALDPAGTITGDEVICVGQSGVSVRSTIGAVGRIRLVAALNLYVRKDGSDSNTGLANTSGGAFLTIQAAVDKALLKYDTYGQSITINVVGTGSTYAEQVIFNGPANGHGLVTLLAVGTVTINSPGVCVQALNGAYIRVEGGFTLQATTFGIESRGQASSVTFAGVTFGACPSGHVYATRFGYAEANGNYSIAGNADSHIQSSHHGNFRASAGTATFTGNVTFVTAFAYCLASSDITYTGTAAIATGGFTITGVRYRITDGSVIQWSTGSATSLPGTTRGLELTGGHYINANYNDTFSSFISYDLSTASGTLTFNSLGFEPGEIEFLAAVNNGNMTSGWATINASSAISQTAMSNIGSNWFPDVATNCMAYYVDATNFVQFAVSGIVDGGFTLAVTKTLAPTGTLRISYKARRRA